MMMTKYACQVKELVRKNLSHLNFCTKQGTVLRTMVHSWKNGNHIPKR